MKWQKLNSEDARIAYESYLENDGYECPAEYQKLQADIKNTFMAALIEIGIDPDNINRGNNAYLTDLEFGLRLYRLLNDEYGMDVRTASDAGVWRFISVKVVPDIIGARYGNDHPDRFWKKESRLWFRVLWWYIYLSWQGSEAATRAVLKDNTTDEILQLVDRCGAGGYRTDLYREIMKQYAALDLKTRRKESLFRKVMVLNTAWVQMMEPDLATGGTAGYVESMFQYYKDAKVTE